MCENGVCMSLTCVTRVSPHAFATISIVGGEERKILHVEIPPPHLAFKTYEKKCQFPAELKRRDKIAATFSPPSLVRISFLPSFLPTPISPYLVLLQRQRRLRLYSRKKN